LNPPIIVNFTTTPERVAYIQPMLESLKNQTLSGFKTILWLSNFYKRSGRSMNKKDVPVFIHSYDVEVRFTEDYGSNTKLLPALKAFKDPNSILLTVDDDTCYPPDWLKGLIKATKTDSSKAYGYRAKVFQRRFLKFPFIKQRPLKPLNYNYSETIILTDPTASISVDILTGVWGICYRRSFFNDDYFNLNSCKPAHHNDDIWANGHLARNQVERICLGLEGSFQDIDMESLGIRRLWDSVNNGKGLNNKVLKYFKDDFKAP